MSMTAEEMLAMRGVSRNDWGGYPQYECYPCNREKRGHSGQRATGIALGASALGITVLGLPLVVVLAKAFSGKAEAMAESAHSAVRDSNENIRLLTQGLAAEAASRQADFRAERSDRAIEIRAERTERVQSNPTTQNYIDLAAGAGAYSGSGSNAAAQAAAAAAAYSHGNYGSGGQVCPTPVALYKPAMPCNCNTYGD